MRRLFAWMVAVGAGLLAGCGTAGDGLGLGQSLGADIRLGALDAANLLRIDQAVDQAIPDRVTSGNNLVLHIDGEAGFGAIRALIQSARKTLWFETFIWHDDDTGQDIARLLQERAAQGVDVRVLVDALGSDDGEAGGHDRDVLRVFNDNGVPVRLYNPNIFSGANVQVTHRKLYLADGDRGLTGGMNIGHEYAHDWHDLLVEARGPVARQLHLEFLHDWNASQDGAVQKLAIPPLQASRYGDQSVRVAVTSPLESDRAQEIHDAEIAAIDAARSKINVFQLYFSDESLIKHLGDAAKRGVNVQLLLPAQNDFETFRYVNRYYANQLLADGVHVKLYEAKFSHVKYLTVDGVWAGLGSANADPRSFYENQELLLLCSDPVFVAKCDHDLFDADWAGARWPTYEDLDVPLLKKPMVTLAQIFSYLL